jgi:diamine N-acetyltransferase
LDALFRRASLADAARLAAFAARTFTQTYAADNTPQDMRDYLASAFSTEKQSVELSDPAMITVLAESGDDFLGYAQLRRGAAPPCVPQRGPVEIYRFYVDAPAHGTGVAQRLMDSAVEAARDLGGTDVWLGVWERNPRAIAFYAKCGFNDVGTQIFQLGSDRQTDRVLVRSVTIRVRPRHARPE